MIGLDPLKVIGKFGGIAGKVGDKAIKKGFKAADKITGKIADGSAKNGFETIKDVGAQGLKGVGKIGIKAGVHVGEELKFQTDALSFMKKSLTGEAPLSSSLLGYGHPITKTFRKISPLKSTEENLIGMKFTNLGKGLLFVGALGVGTGEAVKDFTKERIGTNDGQSYNHAPLFNGQTFKTMGSSYSDNAGATGDLGFALYDQRHTGYV